MTSKYEFFKSLIKLVLLVVFISSPVILAFLSYITPELAAISVALFLGFLGLFRNWVILQFYYPKLDIKFNVAPPDCHKTTLTLRNQSGQIIANAACYYYRLKITNTGNTRAEKIEVMITDKYTKNQKGSFRKDQNFLPLNLKWSHDGVVIRESIAPSLFRYCDVGNIIHPTYINYALRGVNNKKNSSVVLDLDLVVKPNTGGFLIFPGEHRIKIIAVADNSKVFSKIYELNFNNYWNDNESTMLNNGITVQEVHSLN